jgi:hypothetical protein
MPLRVRTLEIIFPLVLELTGVGVTPGPFHCMPVASGTFMGREMEQVRETVAPDIIGDGGEDVSKMVAGTTCKPQ